MSRSTGHPDAVVVLGTEVVAAMHRLDPVLRELPTQVVTA
jgi:hypothetical protein